MTSDSERHEAAAVTRNEITLHLHYGDRGPVDVEVWDNEDDEVHQVLTDYPDSKTSVDLSKDLQRAGYEIVPIEDGDPDE